MTRRACTALGALMLALALPSGAAAGPVTLIGQVSGTTGAVTYDAGTGQLGPGIAAGNVFGVAITPDGQTGVAAVGGLAPAVQQFDLATGVAGTAIPLPGSPSGLALSPDGTRAYVPFEATNQLVVVDLVAKTTGTPIAIGNRPRAIVVNAAGTKAFTANSQAGPVAGGVSIIDLTGSVGPVNLAGPAFDRPESIAITPDGATVYLGNFGAGAGGTTVVPVNTATNTVGTTITVGTSVTGMAVDPTGARLYVLNRDSESLSVIATATNTVVQTFSLAGVSPSRIAITPSGDRAVITDSSNGNVRRIALPGGQAIGDPVPLPGAAFVIAAPAPTPVPAFAVGGTATAGQPLTFDASATTGAEGDVSWSFGDGSSGSGPVVQHTFAAPGTYTATLTATGSCAAGAVFGPAGSSWAGVSAYCAGPRTATTSRTVTVPAVTVPAVPEPKPKPTVKPKPLPPLAKGCLSVRNFAIRLKKGVRARSVTVTIDGRRAKVSRGRQTRARIDLRGKPKKIVVVKIVVTPAKGRKTTTERRYRTCTKEAAGRNEAKL